MNNLRFGPFLLDEHLRQLQRDGERLPLPSKAFDLLWYMCQNAGRPLSKAELMSAVWPDSFVEESNLTHNISQLRRTLGTAEDGAVLTLPGRGYQFAAHVVSEPRAIPAETSPAGSPAVSTTTIALEGSRLVYEEVTEEHVGLWRSPLAVGITAVAALGVAAAAWLGWQRWEDRVGGAPVQVVMADLDGTTGDAVLDRTVTTVTRSELAQSPFVSLLPAAALRGTLTQMMHKTTDPVTVVLAREACERTGSQAVLHESVAHVGSGYVLTEEATNCVDGSSLALVHKEAAKADDLPHAIAEANSVVRHGLGESRRTIARFNVPLMQSNTTSIEALKAYSQASFLSSQGHFAEAIELQKQAITLDPAFAAAYLDLSGYYLNTMDPADARVALQKAYDLRNSATEPAKLYITARYHTYITGDLYEALRNYRAWIAAYPRQVQPWSGLDNVYTKLGQPEEQLDAARHTVQLAPTNLIAYQALALAQIASGDFAAARATCQLALSKHLDTESIHYVLLWIGHLQHDAALLAQEAEWGKEHPDSPIFIGNEATFALQDGRLKEGETLLAATAAALTKQGTAAGAARVEQDEAQAFAALGEPEVARRLLHGGPPDFTDFNYLLSVALTGDPSAAATGLHQQIQLHPQDTGWNGPYKSLILAQVALAQNHPQDALGALSSTEFDKCGLDFHYLRGRAYLALKQLPSAENEFRLLLTHPEVEPNSYELPLVRLEFARTLAAEGKHAESAAAYRDFLSFWSEADPDHPVLLQARRELAALQ